MFSAFGIMRQLHELLWYLSDALALDSAAPLHVELRRSHDETLRLTLLNPEALQDLDLGAHRGGVNALLLRTSELVRSERPTAGNNLRGADLSTSLFLTQPRLNAAKGDGGTRLPSWLSRPGHWVC